MAVEVPDADDMDDETFLKHIEKRHAADMKIEAGTSISRHAVNAWIGSYRAYHERLHEIKEHDHEHVWED